MMPAYAIRRGGSALPPDGTEIERRLSTPTSRVIECLRALPGDFVVLGAGGKMGPTLALMVRRGLDALGRSDRVIAVARFSRSAARELLESQGVIIQTCDLADPGAVAALPEAANVLYLAGQKFGTTDKPEATWIVNVVVPSLLARRYRGARIVVFSTGCVYPLAPVEGCGCDESDSVGFQGEYAATCVGRERVFTHYAAESGTPVLIFRLNYAVEYRYGVLVDIGGKVLAGLPVDVATPVVNVIWQQDACARAIECLARTANPPEIINITGDKVQVRSIAEEFGRYFGIPPSFCGAPAPTAWLANPAKSYRWFGRPERQLGDMVRDIGAYLQSGAPLLGKPTCYEARNGRF